MTDRRPLECAHCGARLWNDESATWVGSRPYCTAGPSGSNLSGCWRYSEFKWVDCIVCDGDGYDWNTDADCSACDQDGGWYVSAVTGDRVRDLTNAD